MELPEGAINANSIEEAYGLAGERGADTLYIAGGRSVYEQFMDDADRMELTEIKEEYEGDTEFPAVDWSRWEEVERDERDELDFVEYESV